jgi:thioredoxin-related protein
MRRALLIFFIAFISISVSAQKTIVKWYSIQEAEQMIKTSPRPIIVDTYTDWCGWCKKLDADTFTNSIIAEILNTKFYPVKLDAEGKDPIIFMGKTFINDGKSGKSHQLAIAMLKGEMSFPNLVFFNDKIQLVTNVPGYKTPKELEVILGYMADKAYENQKFEDYQQNFKSKL